VEDLRVLLETVVYHQGDDEYVAYHPKPPRYAPRKVGFWNGRDGRLGCMILQRTGGGFGGRYGRGARVGSIDSCEAFIVVAGVYNGFKIARRRREQSCRRLRREGGRGRLQKRVSGLSGVN
jgi:hypothetical protein